MKRKAAFGLVTAVLLLVSINLSADATNLLSNSGFETAATGVMPGTHDSLTNLCTARGGSAAGGWDVWSNGCADISTTLEPSTLSGGGSFMIEVNTTGSNGGLVQNFLSSMVPSATASAWVFINSGCVGIGAGDDGNTGLDASTCTTDKWIHLTAPSDSGPVTAFIVYDTATSMGADFFVDNASVAPTPEPGTLTMLGMGILGLSGLGRRFRRHTT